MGNQNLYDQQNITVATVLKFWAEVHAKSHPYGATFAVGSNSNAVVSNTLRTTKNSWTFVLKMHSDEKTCWTYKGISSPQQNTQFLHILQQPISLCWKKCSQKGVEMQLQASGQLLELQWDLHKVQANEKPFSSVESAEFPTKWKLVCWFGWYAEVI